MSLGKLGKYERLEVLGHGASGIVYLAQDTLLKKRVALKEVNADGDDQQRVLEEARVLDRLRHPNIVAVNSVDTIDGKVVIDMEYVQGQTLFDLLRKNDAPLPIAAAVSICAQVCDGLAFAHAQRTVHRDVKPANILVSAENAVKLADFGLAQALGSNSLAGGAGTFAYMAPEDFESDDLSDRQSDIWAVGVILYEMLAGRRPFSVVNTRDPFAWSKAITNDEIDPPSKYRQETPVELDRICLTALCRNKSERYQDAGRMAADLRSLAEPIEPTAFASRTPSSSVNHTSVAVDPILAKFGDLDGFLTFAVDQWEAVGELLDNAQLSGWLRNIREPLFADVAEELEAKTETDIDERVREFLYRAGVDMESEGQSSFMLGAQLIAESSYPEAVEHLQRAVNFDPTRPSYYVKLAQAARLAGDIDLTRAALFRGLTTHSKDRTLKQLLSEIGGAEPELSVDQVHFGRMHYGEEASCQVTIKAVGTEFVKGRISSLPGWLTVTPNSFSGRPKVTLRIDVDTEALHDEEGEFDDNIVIETTGGTIELPVLLSLIPKRPGFVQVMLWYVPALAFCLLPTISGMASTFVSHQHNKDLALLPGGLIASGLLFAAFAGINFAADTNRLEKVASAVGVLLFPIGIYELIQHACHAPESISRVWIPTFGCVLISLTAPGLQTAAYFRAPSTLDRAALWCAGIGLASLVASALLWNTAAR